MAHEVKNNSDSFYIGDDAPELSQAHSEEHPQRKVVQNRSDSPVFGLPTRGNNAMLVEEDLQNISPIQGKMDKKKQNKDPAQIIEELKDKLRRTTQALHEHQEEYKQQLLHIETINMMTKYQLVFIKMEAALIKLANIMKTSRIFQFARSQSVIKKLKTQVIYFNLKDNIEKMVRGLSQLQRGSLNRGFRAIWLLSKLYKAEKHFKEEREKYIKSFNESLLAKDAEITTYKKKIEDLNGVVIASRTKEADLLAKLKQREKQIQSLEAERADIIKSKKSSGGENAQEIKALEEQIRELQQENEELREKLSTAEYSVGSFVKEMSEMLDSHELSTNVGSDNNSFNNPDFEEDLDLINRVKDKGQGAFFSKGKDSSNKNIQMKHSSNQAAYNRYK